MNKKIFTSGLFLGSLFLSSLLVAPVAAAKVLLLSVPFTSQAPLGEWRDERQQDGCEEASALMARAWLNNIKSKSKTEISKKEWREQIIALADFEQEKYQEYRDLSLADMAAWIFEDYFGYEAVSVKKIKQAGDILKELEKGNLVLAPMNGRALKNPYFTPPGPERHMIVIKGYDYNSGQFITNDPGTRRGESYRYSSKTIFNALRAYDTGYHKPFKTAPKEVLIVAPPSKQPVALK